MIRPGQRPIRRPKKSPDRQQTDYNPQVAHPIINPIILQVPNRDANSVKLIRPVQGTFSGLQNAPDSDRFTFLIRRLGGSSPPGRTKSQGVSGSWTGRGIPQETQNLGEVVASKVPSD